jgi:hypothetical protein
VSPRDIRFVRAVYRSGNRRLSTADITRYFSVVVRGDVVTILQADHASVVIDSESCAWHPVMFPRDGLSGREDHVIALAKQYRDGREP